MSVSDDVEAVKKVADRVNLYRIDRGTTNIGVFNSVVSTVQDYYREFRQMPDAKEVLSRMTAGSTHPSVCKIMASPGFEKSMEMRGIPLTNARGLSPQQSILVSVMTNPADRRTMSAKLKHAGVSYHVYNNWLKNPLFKNAVNRQAEDLLDVHTGDVLVQLTNKATSGDLAAMKFYLEVNGRHDPSRKDSVDVRGLMGKILEIISRRVTDPDTLSLIASDFAMLGGAEAVSNSQTIQSEVVQGDLPDRASEAISIESNLIEAPEDNTAEAKAWLEAMNPGVTNPLSGGGAAPVEAFDFKIEEF